MIVQKYIFQPPTSFSRVMVIFERLFNLKDYSVRLKKNLFKNSEARVL
jgi:hypothetical protein